jgi:hypothetical protein
MPTEVACRVMPPFAVSTGGRLLRIIRPSSLSTRTFSTSKCRLEQIHGADEAVCQGPCLLYSLRLLYFDALDACTQTLGRLTAATRTNGRVALVDFYAEFVFGSYDAIIDELMM